MNKILSGRNLFFIKEHIGILKAANNYDILDPESRTCIMTCRENDLGGITKVLRFTKYKRMTPFKIEVKTRTGEKVLTIKRGVSFIISTIEVFDELDNLIGIFKQKFFSIGGGFDVLTANGDFLCSLQGSWTSWDFKFIKDDMELAQVTKKWSGIGKEMFTSADNYIININQGVPQEDPFRILVLAAGMCIDMVLKE